MKINPQITKISNFHEKKKKREYISGGSYEITQWLKDWELE